MYNLPVTVLQCYIQIHKIFNMGTLGILILSVFCKMILLGRPTDFDHFLLNNHQTGGGVFSKSLFQKSRIKLSVEEVKSQFSVLSFLDKVGISNRSAFRFTLSLHLLKLIDIISFDSLTAPFSLEQNDCYWHFQSVINLPFLLEGIISWMHCWFWSKDIRCYPFVIFQWIIRSEEEKTFCCDGNINTTMSMIDLDNWYERRTKFVQPKSKIKSALKW